MDLTPAVLDKLRLAAEHKDNRPSGTAHIVGLKALIEDEYRCVYHTGTLRVF